MTAIFAFSFALVITIIGILLWTRLAWRIATDIPNGRSLHDAPVPRVGGWGVVPAVLAASLAFGTLSPVFAAVAVLLFALSYADDRRGLPIIVRLPMHAAAAAVWLAYGPVQLPFVVAALAAFAIVWVTNLFNFMDGADGLAGGMAVFAFGTYAGVASWSGVEPLALSSMAFAGAAAGFLLFNFNPARVFLGDAGSVTLGFFAGAFGIWGWAADAWPVWFPFLVSAPFFLDATVTILRRMFRGEQFWTAHREHYYQRLIRSGWSHRRTALAEYALMGASSVLAIVMLDWSEPIQYLALAGVGIAYFGIAGAIDRRWAAFLQVQQHDLGCATPAGELSPAVVIAAKSPPQPESVRGVESYGNAGVQKGAHRAHAGTEPGSRRYDERAFQREPEHARK